MTTMPNINVTTMPNINAIRTVLPTINAIPAVVAATPGIVTSNDLPLWLCRGVVPVLNN
jgi:hypothetical protein